MPLKFTKDPHAINRALKKVVEDVPRIAGIEGERFFKLSFTKQGWEDKVFLPWQARKGSNTRKLGEKKQGRAILIQSGALRRSVRVVKRGRNFVVIGSSLPYAKIHNEGGTIAGTYSIRTHKRRNRKSEGTHLVESHTRKVNTKMPRRRFMGNSAALNYQIFKVIRQRIKAI